ncbi:PREDICTED: uncharacterized protein LOC18602625 [Theobroma cacao]|uniref:Uncharacterized protein LOC18602625 n=1 Tax=Theobroma cacao TaxID=3641 RepID=A0AB32V839_THECC|nr:PREDICTED: uncharacterized protein LOC18602625 [Theobroma cacao]
MGQFLNTFAEPSVGAVLKKAKKSRPEIEWEKTMEGTMKFNVDGAANASMGEAGIGGVLRNSRGEIRMMFSKSIGVGDSSLAEVLAIREAFVMFIASQRRDSHMLVKSVSLNAVEWVQEPKSAPWRLRKWVLHIEALKRRVTNWAIKHVRREANHHVDNLAKSGIGREIDLINTWVDGPNSQEE